MTPTLPLWVSWRHALGTLALAAVALTSGGHAAYAGDDTAAFVSARVSSVVDVPGLVVVEAAWPGACPDGSGWEDPRVVTYTKEWKKAVAVREDPRRDDRGMKQLGLYGVTTVPTKLALLDGKPADRTCGCMGSEDLLRWMAGLNKDGRTWSSQLRAKLPDPAEDAALDVDGWLAVADAATCAGHNSAAFDALVHLWQEMPSKAPARAETRRNRVLRGMVTLATTDPAMRARLLVERDRMVRGAMADSADGSYEPKQLLPVWDDVMMVNTLLGEVEHSAAWLRDHQQGLRFITSIRRHRPAILQQLAQAGRYDLISDLVDGSSYWFDNFDLTEDEGKAAVHVWVALRKAGRDEAAATWMDAVTDEVKGPGIACAVARRSLDAEVAAAADKAMVKSCKDKELMASWAAATGK